MANGLMIIIIQRINTSFGSPNMIKYCHLGAIVCAIILLGTAEGLVGKSALVKKPAVVPTFQYQLPDYRHSTRRRNVYTSITATATSNDVSTSKKSESGECYYKRIDGSWKPRKELSRLFVGERLFATRLNECDLLDGKTGPKLFFECGVGKKTRGNWSIVNGMLRLPGTKKGKKGMKPSVIRKKAKKIPTDCLIEVFVSKVWLEHSRFEVCLSREEALSSHKKKKVSASKFTAGEQLSGVVRDVHPYGVFVDVGANRKGLLHISKVAKSKDCYVNKEEGLKSAGLSRGSKVEVVVVSNEKKRLEFDLYVAEEETTPEESSDVTTSIDTKSEEDEEALAWATYNTESVEEISSEEADMWAAYAAYENTNADEEDDDDYYDEDEEIEDALGIGSY